MHLSSGLWVIFISLHVSFLFWMSVTYGFLWDSKASGSVSQNDMKLSLMIQSDDNDCEQVETLCMDK